jgi:hypothetical protein
MLKSEKSSNFMKESGLMLYCLAPYMYRLLGFPKPVQSNVRDEQADASLVFATTCFLKFDWSLCLISLLLKLNEHPLKNSAYRYFGFTLDCLFLPASEVIFSTVLYNYEIWTQIEKMSFDFDSDKLDTTGRHRRGNVKLLILDLWFSL